MNLTKTNLNGLVIIEPKIFKDSRGYFFEPYNKSKFDKSIGVTDFVQDNESKSKIGVLRGFHFQNPPFEQAKLVRCIQGEVLDVALDLRKKSPTFSKVKSVILSEKNKKQLFIPRGFAHAFLVLSEIAILSYKVDNFYSPDHESGIIWNDHSLKIDWLMEKSEIIISEKDKRLYELNKTKILF
jgi:dTDP-4-dehydrorhamnose 3,5-epimerase